jgi:ethanolamine ammonia-lyase small subunit
MSSIEERLASVETSVHFMMEDTKEIKKEIKDIGDYIRQELGRRIASIDEKQISEKQARRDKIKIWVAVAIGSISIALTTIHILL